jgi:hypothetical protein
MGSAALNGTLTYSYSDLDPGRAVLRIDLHNTTPAYRGGFLTAFAWNNPGNRISGVESYTTSDNDFKILGKSSFQNRVKAAPFGRFDMGVAIGKKWEGGGSPHHGLAPGASATFEFVLLGTDLGGINEASFWNELSAPPGDGEGNYAFAARFRGFKICGPDSDKVPNDPIQILHQPEPSSFVLAGIGAVGLAAFGGWRRWRRLRK